LEEEHKESRLNSYPGIDNLKKKWLENNASQQLSVKWLDVNQWKKMSDSEKYKHLDQLTAGNQFIKRKQN
jgi:hypothetical protein